MLLDPRYFLSCWFLFICFVFETGREREREREWERKWEREWGGWVHSQA